MRQATMERPHPAGMGGTQRIYRFGNGYGASVVQFPYSYGGDRGMWELAVTKYEGEDNDRYSQEHGIKDRSVHEMLEKLNLPTDTSLSEVEAEIKRRNLE